MIVKFLDTETNETAWSFYPLDIYWWSEGNGSCDCNRAVLFGHEAVCGEQPYRYKAVDIADHIDISIEQQLRILNGDLLEKFHLQTKEHILQVINKGLY